ncbi:hypothetical protein GCM10011612_08470 [Actinomyces gaoshouyii]|uniref:HTH cro/C1-type domain-containing protein n=1 Tax=Actinomyces gaoshouyii TaxID=1960083 RepID=A0A8H9HCR5_9ACTO|nr:hypothetical protein GCM10011612_08470 [Actinomyces gaoshouyii]
MRPHGLRAGLTQAELVDCIGSWQSVIFAVENGGRVISVLMLRRIVRALEVNLVIDMAAVS